MLLAKRIIVLLNMILPPSVAADEYQSGTFP